MEKNELYQEWKTDKMNAGPPADFTSDVMRAVFEYEKMASKSRIERFLITARTLVTLTARVAFGLGLSLAGFYRLYLPLSLLIPT